MIGWSTFWVSDTVTGFCLISIPSNNLLKNICCFISESVNHVSNHGSNISQDLWFVNFILHLNWQVRMCCEASCQMCLKFRANFTCCDCFFIAIISVVLECRCKMTRHLPHGIFLAKPCCGIFSCAARNQPRIWNLLDSWKCKELFEGVAFLLGSLVAQYYVSSFFTRT